MRYAGTSPAAGKASGRACHSKPRGNATSPVRLAFLGARACTLYGRAAIADSGGCARGRRPRAGAGCRPRPRHRTILRPAARISAEAPLGQSANTPARESSGLPRSGRGDISRFWACNLTGRLACPLGVRGMPLVVHRGMGMRVCIRASCVPRTPCLPRHPATRRAPWNRGVGR